MVTVFNEEAAISEKIDNILACDYPGELLEVLVASDGSTDSTEEIVSRRTDPRVRLFRPRDPAGKTDTQNRAIAEASGEIVVFTDADTRFDPDFLTHIVRPFGDPGVGCVDGHFQLMRGDDGALSTNQGYYWRYELSLRRFESDLGLLAVSTGACFAIRKALFRPMETSVGEDCVIPLDIVSQGFRVVHSSAAIAWDRMPADVTGEFRARVRMTLRNWQGTWAYGHLLNPFRHPGYAFALWSHKILRWLSPVFLIAATAAVLAGLQRGGVFVPLAVVFGGFYAAGAVGWIAQQKGIAIPGVGSVFSFLLANAGFFVGLVRAIVLRDNITAYKGPRNRRRS